MLRPLDREYPFSQFQQVIGKPEPWFLVGGVDSLFCR